MDQKDKTGALSDLETAYKMKPFIKQIWPLIIGLKIEFKQFLEASSFLTDMIKIDPTDEKWLESLARCNRNLGNLIYYVIRYLEYLG